MYSQTISDDVTSESAPPVTETPSRTATLVGATLTLMIGLALTIFGLTMGLTVMLVVLGLTPFALAWTWFATRRGRRQNVTQPSSDSDGAMSIVTIIPVSTRVSGDDKHS